MKKVLLVGIAMLLIFTGCAKKEKSKDFSELPLKDKPFVCTLERYTEGDKYAPKIDNNGNLTVCCRVSYGTLKTNEKVKIIGLNEKAVEATVVSMEVLYKSRDEVIPGDNVTLHLDNGTVEDIKFGKIIAKEEFTNSITVFEADIYLKESNRDYILKNGYYSYVTFNRAPHYGSEISTIDVLSTSESKQGDSVKVRITMYEKETANVGDSVYSTDPRFEGKVTKVIK